MSNLSGRIGACRNCVQLTFTGRLNRHRGHSAAIPATQRGVTVLIQICIACSIKKADFFFVRRSKFHVNIGLIYMVDIFLLLRK